MKPVQVLQGVLTEDLILQVCTIIGLSRVNSDNRLNSDTDLVSFILELL